MVVIVFLCFSWLEHCVSVSRADVDSKQHEENILSFKSKDLELQEKQSSACQIPLTGRTSGRSQEAQMAWIRDAEPCCPKGAEPPQLRAVELAMGREVTYLHMSLGSCSIARHPPFTWAML